MRLPNNLVRNETMMKIAKPLAGSVMLPEKDCHQEIYQDKRLYLTETEKRDSADFIFNL